MKLSNYAACISLGLLLAGAPGAFAQEAPPAVPEEEEALRQAYESAMQEADREREAAMAAVEKAREEMVHAIESRARAAAEVALHEAERSDLESMRRKEVEDMRRELSRVQEELRRASREVVRVHRELDGPSRVIEVSDTVRFNNKAVIGVILGDSDERGVKVLGVSPDGPSERAGIAPGDVIVSIMGEPLASADGEPASRVLLEVMESVKPGDEMDITVLRDGAEQNLKVTAEEREPVSWTSLIRLPSAPDAPDAPLVIKERIAVPQIDKKALAEKMEQLQHELEERKIIISSSARGLAGIAPEVWEFDFENLSELGETAVHSANVWFGMPLARGLKLAEVNAQLGDYFKTDYGVLVLTAAADNELQLEAGDVVLAVDGKRVEKPVEVMRELRNLESGAEAEIEIMRQRKRRTLDVIVPEHDHKMGFAPEADHSYRYRVEVKPD